MNFIKKILFLIILFPKVSFAQQYSIEAKVQDETGNSIENADVSINFGKFHSTTDSNGNFKFTNLSRGIYHIDIYYLGFQTLHYDLNLQSNVTGLILSLKPQAESLNEVEIHSNSLLKRQKEASLASEVVNASYIQQNMQGSLMKSLDELPGISSIEVGSGQAKPMIRGLSFNQVAVVENGIKHEGQQWGEDHGLEIDPYTVKQVEIIKGPTSLLYGSDAIGGIMLLNSETFPSENGWQSQMDLHLKSNNNAYGGSANFNYRKNNFYFDQRVSYTNFADYKVPTDSISIYSYKASLKDNRLRNTAGREMAFHSQWGIINTNHQTRLFLSYYHTDNAFFANAHGLEPRYVNTTLHDASHRDIQEPHQTANHLKAILNSTWFADYGKWEAELGIQQNKRNEWSDYVNHGYMPAEFSDTLGISSQLERAFDKSIFSANLKFHKQTEKHEWSAGSQWEYQKNKINGWSFIIPSFNRNLLGFFVYDKFKLNQKTHLNAGIRYDFGNLKTSDYYDWFPSNGEFLQRSFHLNKQYQQWSGAIGLSYSLPSFQFKTHIGKSFRMPIAKEIASNGVNYHHFSYEIGNQNLKAEISYQWDIAFEWNKEKWALQISPFINYFPNYIYLNPTSEYDFLYGAGNQVYYYQETKVLRTGGELHGHYNLTQQFKTDLIAELVYSEQMSGTKKGFNLPFAPAPNIINKLNYKLENKENWKDTNFELSHTFTFKQNRIIPPEEKTPSSSVWNFSATTSYQLKNQTLTFSLQINNILNTIYYNHTNYYRIIGVPEAGRNFTFGLQIK